MNEHKISNYLQSVDQYIKKATTRVLYMEKIFAYARDKIKKKYESRFDYSCKDVKLLEEYELCHIDFYEEEAKEGLTNTITCSIKVFWYVQTDVEKFYIGTGIAITLSLLLVFLSGIKSVPLNILILNTSESFFFCFVALGIISLYRLIRKNVIKNKLFYIVWIFFLLLSIPHIPVLFGYRTTQIGDFYESKEYTEKYYVIMSRQPKENKGRKIYTLPAEIERSLDYSYTTDVYEDYYSQVHGGEDVYVLNYHINHLYFPNGGYLYFDESTNSILQVGQETEVIDYHDNTYYVTLTNEKYAK